MLGKRVAYAKTAEPIEMPFGGQTRVGPRNLVLDGVQVLNRKAELLTEHVSASCN